MTAPKCAKEDLPPGSKAHSPLMTRIFRTLCEKPWGLTMLELVDEVYGDDPEGGPDWAHNSICVTICRFNQRAQAQRLGIRIWTRNSYGRVGNGHRYYIFIVREPR